MRCAPDSFTFADADASLASDGGDLDINTAQCDGGLQSVPDNEAVWVSGANGDDSTSCTRISPCKTISAALVKAQAQGIHVAYLDAATYVEALTIGSALSGFTLQGGWQSASGWTQICDDTLTQIVAPADAGSAAIEVDDASDITLRLLTVRSKDVGGIGESVYAIRIENSASVVLDNVALYAQQGGAGAGGGVGSTDGGCMQDASGSGAVGDAGAPGAAGTFDDKGYEVAFAASGADGQLGQSTLGGKGMCGTSCITGYIGGCPGATCGYGLVCASDGTTGCAGFGGGGGQGGQGGGAAIALFATGSSVAVYSGGFFVGPGGAGGNGGQGGAAGIGGPGDAGTGGACSTGACCASASYLLDGGAAGIGGAGGAGGQGGGGAGGPLYFWGSLDASVSVSPETLAVSKFVGTPGSGGQPNGIAGSQAAHP